MKCVFSSCFCNCAGIKSRDVELIINDDHDEGELMESFDITTKLIMTGPQNSVYIT